MTDDHSPSLDFDADDDSGSASEAERYTEWVHYPAHTYPFEVEFDDLLIEVPDKGVHRVIDAFIQFHGEEVSAVRDDEEDSDTEVIDDDLVSTVPSPYPSSPEDS